MPAPELRASIDQLRREAELACQAASLRAVAAQISMSAMGLRAFVRGDHTPQDRTLRKLHRWYGTRMAAHEARGETEARAALVLLAGLYPRADRPRVVEGFVAQLAREFEASGMPAPPWLDPLGHDLRRTLEPG